MTIWFDNIAFVVTYLGHGGGGVRGLRGLIRAWIANRRTPCCCLSGAVSSCADSGPGVSGREERYYCCLR